MRREIEPCFCEGKLRRLQKEAFFGGMGFRYRQSTAPPKNGPGVSQAHKRSFLKK
jgi:hypothetical protein